MAAVIVVETERNSYYLHEVAIQEKGDNTLFKTGTVKNGTSGKVLSSPIFTLLQKLQSVKNESEDNTEYQSRTADIDNAYLEAVKNNNLIKAQQFVDEYAVSKGFLYRRCTPNYLVPHNKVPWMMFVKAEDNYSLHQFGDYNFVAHDRGAIDVEDIKDEIQKLAVEYCGAELEDEVINPPDIVDSAGMFDDMDFIQFLWDNYFEKLWEESGEIPAVKTEDGLIVFYDDYNRIKSSDPITYDDNGNVIPLSERFNYEKSDIRYQSRNTEPDYNFFNALNNKEWGSFYASVKESNQRDNLRIGDYGILIPDENNSSNYKLVYCNGNSATPRVKAVYKLENYEYTIHEEQLDFETILDELRWYDKNDEHAKTILENNSRLYGTVFKEYSGESWVVISEPRESVPN